MMGSKTVPTGLMLAAAAIAAGGCGSSSSSSSSNASATVAKSKSASPYVIGVDTAQTGAIAPFDQPFLKGLRLAVREANAKGGLAGTHPIQLKVENGASDSGRTVTAAKDLVDQNVDFLLTPCDGDLSTAAGQIAQRANVPAMSSCASVPTMTTAVGDYMFGNYFGDNADGAVAAKYAYDHGVRKAFILASKDNSYTEGVPTYWADAFQKLGGKIVGKANYSLGQQSFSVIVTQIQNTNPKPDVIFTAAFEPDFPTFVKQLRAAGVQTPVYGGDAVDTPGVLALGKQVNGSIITAPGFDAPGTPYAKFVQTYTQAYGSKPEAPYAASGQDAIDVLDAAVRKAGSADKPAVRDAIAGLQNVAGATGKITYAGTERMPLKAVYVLKLINGKEHLMTASVPNQADVPAPRGF